LVISCCIDVREYRRGNQKWTIQRNCQHGYTRRRKTRQKHNIICDGHHYAPTNTNNVNKTSTLQLEVETNRTSFLCGNGNGHHNAELRT
jgi:hypothetical protein